MTSVEQRYRSDPQFKALVETMVAYIQEAKFTPSELREAAILAAIIYETRFSAFERLKHGQCFYDTCSVCGKPISFPGEQWVNIDFDLSGDIKRCTCEDCVQKARASLEVE